MMNVASLIVSQKTRRVLSGWIVIAALACHGLIPLGYMPDMNHRAGHPFAMTICGGMHQPPMTGDTDKDKNGKKFQGHIPCPFSINAVFACGGGAPGAVGPTYIFIAVLAFAAFAWAPLRRHGNASPRAPPRIS